MALHQILDGLVHFFPDFTCVRLDVIILDDLLTDDFVVVTILTLHYLRYDLSLESGRSVLARRVSPCWEFYSKLVRVLADGCVHQVQFHIVALDPGVLVFGIPFDLISPLGAPIDKLCRYTITLRHFVVLYRLKHKSLSYC